MASLLPSLGMEGAREQAPPLLPLSQGEAISVTCLVLITVVSGRVIGLVPTLTRGRCKGQRKVQFGLGQERGQTTP